VAVVSPRKGELGQKTFPVDPRVAHPASRVDE
jgi:hypothetical protein